LAQAAHVSVALNGAGALDERQCADLVLAGDSLESFADLMEWAASYGQRVQGISRKAVLPNLLCIAGAFGGVLNGTTAGLIANTGVYRSYRQARNGFREIRDAQGTGWRRVYP
jgi:cation transport ATPase